MKRSFTLLVASLAIAFQSFGQIAVPPSRIDLQQQFLLPGDDRQETDPFAPHQHPQQARKGQPKQNAAQPLSSNAIKQRLDSVVTAGSSKSHYFYNANGKLTHIRYTWNTSTNTWVSSRKYDYTYDSNGNRTLSIWHTWNTSTNAWISSNKYEHTYNANEKLISSIGYIWNVSTNAWIIDWKAEHTYNSNEKLILSIDYAWNTSTNAWIRSYKSDYTYNSNGNRVLSIGYTWNTGANAWIDNTKYEYAYDANGKQTLESYYTWNASTNAWVGNNKYEFSYDANGNQVLSIWYTWNTSTNTWVGNDKYELSYDINGNQIQQIIHTWNTNNNTWISNSKDTYIFNLSYTRSDLIAPVEWLLNMLTISTGYVWNSTTNNWVQNYTRIYYYSPQEVTSIREPQSNTAKLYPNPATEFFNVALLDNAGKATIELYDVQGRKILAQTIDGNGQVAVNELKTGLYFYSLITDKGKKQSGKLVKQ